VKKNVLAYSFELKTIFSNIKTLFTKSLVLGYFAKDQFSLEKWIRKINKINFLKRWKFSFKG